ncbi:hypothetical protein EVAR_55909_1 [Eumeta japonica]|uniref:Uncharacterized protein n=1 Tax=Eumeta variegata TaxID=151549 RepID=A0A4C1YM83_EUMVA|nr:hypothetical protein EVAR_55909_1 [Eumeta japonica]
MERVNRNPLIESLIEEKELKADWEVKSRARTGSEIENGIEIETGKDSAETKNVTRFEFKNSTGTKIESETEIDIDNKV